MAAGPLTEGVGTLADHAGKVFRNHGEGDHCGDQPGIVLVSDDPKGEEGEDHCGDQHGVVLVPDDPKGHLDRHKRF